MPNIMAEDFEDGISLREEVEDILTSKNAVSRFIGQGADTSVIRGIEVIYLGRSCDAYSQTLGGGAWCWGNGGFVAEFAGSTIGFPRQELHCANPVDLGAAYSC